MVSFRRIARAFVIRALLVAVLLGAAAPLAVTPTAAAAGSIRVKVRVEGISTTHVNSTVELPCEPAAPSALDAVVRAVYDAGKTCVVRDLGWGKYLSAVAGDVEGTFGGWDGWMYTVIRDGAVDPAAAMTGAGSYRVADGDNVVFYYGGVVWPTPVTALHRVSSPEPGKVRVRLVDLSTSDGIGQAAVRARSVSEEVYSVTDDSGYAILDIGDDGEWTVTAVKTNEAGAPLIARPEPLSLWVEDGSDYLLGLDPPTIGATSYNSSTRTLTVVGSVYAGAEVVGRVLDWGAVVGEASAQGASGQYTLAIPSIPGGSYTLSVFARLADGTRSIPATRSVSVLPDVALSDALLAERVALAKSYLIGLQQDDGNLGSWPAIELAASGKDLSTIVKNGKTHLQYLTDGLANGYLPSTPSTTDYAKTILEVLACGANPSNIAERNLVEVLESRQADGHFGLPGEATWVNSHVWAILALKKAGRAIPNSAAARQWLLNARNVDKAWGFARGVSSSPDMTAMAVRALLALGESASSEVITDAVGFIATKQADDGGVFDDSFGSPADSNVYSTAEVVKALCEAGVNPLSESWVRAGGKNMLSYLVACQSSNGQVKSVKGTADFVGAVTAFSRAGFSVAGSGDGGPGGSGGSGGNQPSTIRVSVEVRGRDRQWRKTVTLNSSDATPLSALLATGASVNVRDGNYVAGIDGESESGASGWKYAVNGVVPAVACSDYTLRNGDEVVWFWAKNYLDTGGFRDSAAAAALPPVPPKPDLSAEQAREREEARNAAVGLLRGTAPSGGPVPSPGLYLETSAGCLVVRVAGKAEDMLPEEARYWKAALERNIVDESRDIDPASGGVVSDSTGEIAVSVPAGALAAVHKITVVEGGAAGGGFRLPRSHTAVSPVYSVEGGPASLAAPIEITIRVIPPDGTNPEDLVMARYDATTRRWLPLPSVYDPLNGQVTATSSEFGAFAVLARTTPVIRFADVTDDQYGWARESIEMLATSGCVNGAGPNSFDPGRTVTRAEFVKMLVLAMGLEPLSGKTAPFVDVSGNEWHSAYLAAAAAAGLVAGGPDGLFRPDDPVSRQEAAVLLARCLKASDGTNGGGGATPGAGAPVVFRDSGQVAGWAREAVSTAASLGIIKGAPDGSFMPGRLTSRAEAAVMLARLLSVPGRR